MILKSISKFFQFKNSALNNIKQLISYGLYEIVYKLLYNNKIPELKYFIDIEILKILKYIWQYGDFNERKLFTQSKFIDRFIDKRSNSDGITRLDMDYILHLYFAQNNHNLRELNISTILNLLSCRMSEISFNCVKTFAYISNGNLSSNFWLFNKAYYQDRAKDIHNLGINTILSYTTNIIKENQYKSEMLLYLIATIYGLTKSQFIPELAPYINIFLHLIGNRIINNINRLIVLMDFHVFTSYFFRLLAIFLVYLKQNRVKSLKMIIFLFISPYLWKVTRKNSK